MQLQAVSGGALEDNEKISLVILRGGGGGGQDWHTGGLSPLPK